MFLKLKHKDLVIRSNSVEKHLLSLPHFPSVGFCISELRITCRVCVSENAHCCWKAPSFDIRTRLSRVTQVSRNLQSLLASQALPHGQRPCSSTRVFVVICTGKAEIDRRDPELRSAISEYRVPAPTEPNSFPKNLLSFPALCAPFAAAF